MNIIFYDLFSLCPGTAWSPNTRKARFCLNYKGIPYKTEWVEWPDIQSIYEKHGLQATSSHPDGSPRYTLPVIHDPSTNTSICDSFLIAEYLDKTYPNNPLIFPHDTRGLQATFEGGYFGKIGAMIPLIVPDICHNILTPTSLTVYKPQMEKVFGIKMDDFSFESEVAVGAWKTFKDGLGDISCWYEKTDGPFLMGNTISWADFVVISPLLLIRSVWGEDSRQWRDVIQWNEGTWRKLIDALDKYTTVI